MSRSVLAKGTRKCPNCNEHKERLSRHWHHCGYPEVDWLTDQYLTGILLGGGSIQGNGDAKHLVVKSTNERLARWIFGELDFLTHSLRKKTFEGEREPLFIVRTHAHDHLRRLRDEWYDEGGAKHIRPDVDLSPDAARVWYALAGFVEQTGPYPSQWRLAFSAEGDRRAEGIQTVLSRHSIECKRVDRRVIINPPAAEPWLEALGQPLPGVEHKWQFEETTYDPATNLDGHRDKPQWDDETKVGAVRRAAAALGEPLSRMRYREWARDSDVPGPQAICNNPNAPFENWASACDAADVTPLRATGPAEWTEDGVCRALRAAKRDLGERFNTTSYTEWATGRADAPSTDTVYRVFDDWHSACEVALRE